MKKKLIILTCCLLLSASGCGQSDKGSADDSADTAKTIEIFTPTPTVQETTTEETQEPETQEPETKKWTPPAGSKIDNKTGTVTDKDGVVIGNVGAPHAALPGSLG